MKKTICLLLGTLMIINLVACGQKSAAPTWQEQYDLGVRYLSEGNYDEAIIAFTAAIEIDPKQAPAYIGRGDAYIGSGETEETLSASQADYERAIELDETNAQAYLGLADVFIRRGKYDEALEILQEALEKTGNDKDIADKIKRMKQGVITDASGKERRIISYDASGSVMYYLEFGYDQLTGRKAVVTSYDSAGIQTNQLSLTYDEEGRELYSYLLWNDGIVRRVLYEYNEAGNELKSTEYNIDGSVSVVGQRTYDSQNRLMRIDWSNDKEEIFGSYVYEYNAQGQVIKNTHELSDGSIAWYQTFEYNSAGNETKRSTFDEHGNLWDYWTSNFDENGNLVQRDKYDAEGNLIQSTKY